MAAPLLRLLRALPARVEPPEANAASQLVASARRHALSALVRHALAEGGVTLPPPHDEDLRRDAGDVVGTNLRLKALLLESLDALAAEGVQAPVVLKGYPLAARLYPQPLLRPSTDVDLLVSEADLAAAHRALEKPGLRRVLDPGYGDYLSHHHHYSYVGAAGTVELHFRPAFGLGSALCSGAMFDRAVSLALEGRAVRHLAPEDELLYLCVHAAQHAFVRVGWLHDLKLLIGASSGLDWRVLVERARASGMGVAVRTALEVAQSALGADVPEHVLRALPGGAVRARAARRIFHAEELESPRWAERKVPAFFLRSLLCTGVRATLRHGAEAAGRVLRRRAPEAYEGSSLRSP